MGKVVCRVASNVAQNHAKVKTLDTYPLVVLANEPSSYRSLLAAELPFLRPDLRVLEIAPAQLDATLRAYRPSLVICSRSPEDLPVSRCSVLKLYCDQVDTFIQSPDETIINPRLPEILGVIDRALPTVPARRQRPARLRVNTTQPGSRGHMPR